MKIATVLHCHGNTELVLDTLDSIKTYVGEDVLVLVDGSKWKEWGQYLPVENKHCGFIHDHYPGPYKDVVFGQLKATEMWPDADWYLHTEYDALFVSDFLDDLVKFYDQNKWCLGSNWRTFDFKLPLLNDVFGWDIQETVFLMGCVQFYHAEFTQALRHIDFYRRFLSATNTLTKGAFPGFKGFDVGEHLFPTVAATLGGEERVGELSTWPDYDECVFRGEYRKYVIRYHPEIGEDDNFPEAAIFHPMKDPNNSVREYHKVKRHAKNQKS